MKKLVVFLLGFVFMGCGDQVVVTQNADGTEVSFYISSQTPAGPQEPGTSNVILRFGVENQTDSVITITRMEFSREGTCDLFPDGFVKLVGEDDKQYYEWIHSSPMSISGYGWENPLMVQPHTTFELSIVDDVRACTANQTLSYNLDSAEYFHKDRLYLIRTYDADTPHVLEGWEVSF